MRAAIVLVIFWAAFVAPSVHGAVIQWSKMPTNITVELGANALFSGAAHSSDSQPVSYQWFKDYEEIPGATNDTLVITNVNYSMQSHLFMLWASVPDDPLSRRNSNPVFITIPQSPPVARFPLTVDRSLVVASNLYVDAQVTGERPLHYQWFDGPRPIYGATSSSLQIQHTFSPGPYYAVVSNIFGIATGRVSNVNLMYPPEVISTSYRTGMVGTAIESAPDGDLYALRNNPGAGQTPAGGFEIARLNSALSEQWRLEFRGTRSEAGAMLSDTNGNLFIWAKFDTLLMWSNAAVSIHSSPNGVLIKLNPAGGILAMEPVGTGETDKAVAITLRSNALWTVENARTNLPSQALTLIRPILRTFNLDGTPTSRFAVTNFPPVPLSTNGTVITYHVEDFALTDDGGFILAGSIGARFTWPNQVYTYKTWPVLAAYDGEGNVQWFKNPVTESSETSAYGGTYKSLFREVDGNIYAGLSWLKAPIFPAAWISKLTPEGEEIWRFPMILRNAQTGNVVTPEKLELLPNGNLRVTGWARGDLLDMDFEYYSDGAFVLDLTPAGKLNWPAIYRLAREGYNATSAEDSLTLPNGKTYVIGQLGLALTSTKRAYVAELGYATPRETTAVPRTHVVSRESGLTLRPNIFASGPVAFEWQRDGHILGDENFASISLSPAELERPAKYSLIVRGLGGSYTNAPISVGWARMQLDPANGVHMNVALPADDAFRIEARPELETAASWTSLTNTISTGSTFTLELDPTEAQQFLRVIPQP